MANIITALPRTACAFASTQTVPGLLRPLIPAVVQKAEKLTLPPSEIASTNYTLSKRLPKGALKISTSISSTSQVRFAHTDIQVPDFSAYKRPKDVSSQDSGESSKLFSYMLLGAGGTTAVYGAKVIVADFVSSMSASADVLALAQIEVKLGDIPEGKNVTFKWRGKPLFVRHRTAEEIATERAVDLGTLRDVQHDDDRVQKPDWLILVGVCTHLGCVPIANSGDYGGYYCPCHGSHYDASGRIRKGPAPLNLEIPQYQFPDEETVLVG